MTDKGTSFIGETMRRYRADLCEIRRDFAAPDIREAAIAYFGQGFMARIASIHAGIDEIRYDMRLARRSPDLVDAP